MIRKQSLLDNVKIAKPCPALWSEMEGDERVRHCKLCALNVYDVSGMSRDEAESLMRGTSGRLCLRLHYRPDGRIITKDCPVGIAALRRRLAFAVASGVAILIAGLGKAASIRSNPDSRFWGLYSEARQKVIDTGILGKHDEPAVLAGEVALGMYAAPTPIPTPPSKTPAGP